MREEHEVPEWLGDYKLRNLIARGGMGEVWLAAKHGTGKPCVVKVLRREFSRDPEYRRRFFREARILELLNHGRIVPIIHFGEHQGWLYIVMAYIDGVDLGRFCRAVFEHGEGLPVEVVGYIAGDVLEALRHAHERAPGGRPLRIIHRDVTPGNVLISSEGEVFVTDFGVARQLGDVSADVFGTLDYMAPEQWEGEPCFQSDLYGLGGLILFMLTGRPPRRVKTPSEMHGNLRPVLGDLGRDDTPEPLERLLRLCLEPDLAKRLRSAREGILLLEKWNGYGKRAIVTSALYKRHVGPQRTGLTGILRSAPRPWTESTEEEPKQPSMIAGEVITGGTVRAERGEPPSPVVPANAELPFERTEVLPPPGPADVRPPSPEPSRMEAAAAFISGATVRVEAVEPTPQVRGERLGSEVTVLLVPEGAAVEAKPSSVPRGSHDLESSIAYPEVPAMAESEPQPPEMLWRPWWSEDGGDDLEEGVTMRFVPSKHPRPRSLPPAHLAEPDAPRLFRRTHGLPPNEPGEPSASSPRPSTQGSSLDRSLSPPHGAASNTTPPDRTGDPSANVGARPDEAGSSSTKVLALGLVVASILAVASTAGPHTSQAEALARYEHVAATSAQGAVPSWPAARDHSTRVTP